MIASPPFFVMINYSLLFVHGFVQACVRVAQIVVGREVRRFYCRSLTHAILRKSCNTKGGEGGNDCGSHRVVVQWVGENYFFVWDTQLGAEGDSGAAVFTHRRRNWRQSRRVRRHWSSMISSSSSFPSSPAPLFPLVSPLSWSSLDYETTDLDVVVRRFREIGC